MAITDQNGDSWESGLHELFLELKDICREEKALAKALTDKWKLQSLPRYDT